MQRHARNLVVCFSCGRAIRYDQQRGAWIHSASLGTACGWQLGTYAHPHLIERRNRTWS